MTRSPGWCALRSATRPWSSGHFNVDRRCENDDLYGPDFRDRRLTVVRLDEVDEAGVPVRPLTAVLHYAMHGTVFAAANTLLSRDAPGAMALAANDALGVPVIYLQGAAGDVAPAGDAARALGPQRVERIGVLSAPTITSAFARPYRPARPNARPCGSSSGARRSRAKRSATSAANSRCSGGVGCIFAASAAR